MSFMQILLSAGLFSSFLSVALFLALTQYVEMGAVHIFICLLVSELPAPLPQCTYIRKDFHGF